MTVEPGAGKSDVQNVSMSERKHKVFFPMDVLLGRVIHVEGVRKGYPLTFFFFCDLSNNL